MKPTNLTKAHEQGVLLKTNFSNRYPTTPQMTPNLVAPPPHVWERIEKILDEQDRKKNRNPCLAPVKTASKSNNRFAVYLAAAGATVITTIVLILR
jgi:hypothetical protein